jgi:hypothetical protein
MIGGEKTDGFRNSDVYYNYDALVKSPIIVIPANAGIQNISK